MAKQPSDAVEWVDSKGRHFLVQLLDREDQDLSHGLIYGPPLEVWDVLEDLPEEIRLRLWNELYYRGLFTQDDVRLRPQDVEGALRAALRLDQGRIVEAYNGGRD